jgi:hypothetical protein
MHGVDAHFVCVKRACIYSMSIYTNPIFEESKLPISKILRIIYCWAIGFGVRILSTLLSIGFLNTEKMVLYTT